MSFPQSTTYINSIPVQWSISPSSQSVTAVSISFVGTSTRTLGVSTVLSIKIPIPTPTPNPTPPVGATPTPNTSVIANRFTLSPTDLFNPATIYTVPQNAVFPDGSYTARMTYTRADGAIISSSTASLSFDGTTLPPTLTSPTNSSYWGSSMRIAYTLPESPRLSGFPVTLTFVGTTNTTPIVWSMSSTTTIDYSQSTSNVTATGNIRVTDASSLPEDVYSVTLSYVDIVNHPAASASSSFITVDRTSPTITTVTAPPSNTNSGNPIFAFSSSEGGTVSVGGDCRTAASAVIGGTNTITLAANTSGAPLPVGSYTNCTVTVTDFAQNQSSSLDIPSFIVDTTAPVVSLIGANPILAIQGASYSDPGATALDDIDGDVSASLQVTNVDTSSTTVRTAVWSAMDAAGNVGTASRLVAVIAPTPTPAPTSTPTASATPVGSPTVGSSPTSSPTETPDDNQTLQDLEGVIYLPNGNTAPAGIVVYSYAVGDAQASRTNAASTSSESGFGSTVTDVGGRYVFNDLPKGMYRIRPNLTGVTFSPESVIAESGRQAPLIVADVVSLDSPGCSLEIVAKTVVEVDARVKSLADFGESLAKRYDDVAVLTLSGRERSAVRKSLTRAILELKGNYTEALRRSEALPKIVRHCSENSACRKQSLKASIALYRSPVASLRRLTFFVIRRAREGLESVTMSEQSRFAKHTRTLHRAALRATSRLPKSTADCE